MHTKRTVFLDMNKDKLIGGLIGGVVIISLLFALMFVRGISPCMLFGGEIMSKLSVECSDTDDLGGDIKDGLTAAQLKVTSLEREVNDANALLKAEKKISDELRKSNKNINKKANEALAIITGVNAEGDGHENRNKFLQILTIFCNGNNITNQSDFCS